MESSPLINAARYATGLEMKTRNDDLKQAVRLGVRKIRIADIAGDLATVLTDLTERLQIIRSLAEFVVRDVTPNELSEAIIETFDEIDAERMALEPIARFCRERLGNEMEESMQLHDSPPL